MWRVQSFNQRMQPLSTAHDPPYDPASHEASIMKLLDARTMALDLMAQHKLTGRWRFQFDNAKKRCGMCSYRKKTIQLSRFFVRLNDEATVRNTILHEIAHALTGPGHGHDWTWKRQAKAIGCTGERCTEAVTVQGPYVAACACKVTYGHRKPKYLGVRNAYTCTHKCKQDVTWEHNRGQYATAGS